MTYQCFFGIVRVPRDYPEYDERKAVPSRVTLQLMHRFLPRWTHRARSRPKSADASVVERPAATTAPLMAVKHWAVELCCVCL